MTTDEVVTGVKFYFQVFHEVAYKARNRKDILAGIDEFLEQVTVLPPGEWDASIRIEPPLNIPKDQVYTKSMHVDGCSCSQNN